MTAPSPVIPCPPWCAEGHAPSELPDAVHLSEGHEVPCEVTSRAAGHFCGYTNGPHPEYRQESCDVQNFAQLVLSDDGTYVTVEVGHGDDMLPAMRLDAAEQYARAILALVAIARQAGS